MVNVFLFLRIISCWLDGCSARLTIEALLKERDVRIVAFVGEPVISKTRKIVVSESSAFFKQLNVRFVESYERKL